VNTSKKYVNDVTYNSSGDNTISNIINNTKITTTTAAATHIETQ